MAHDIFISYSHKDSEVANEVYRQLSGAGFGCWIAPDCIMPGQGWADAIVEAIAAAKVMVVIFTSRSNSSEQVTRELKVAADKGVKILPFRIEKVTPEGGLEFFLGTAQWLEATTPPLQSHIDHLIDCLPVLLKWKTGTVPRLPVDPRDEPKKADSGGGGEAPPPRKLAYGPLMIVPAVALLAGLGILAWNIRPSSRPPADPSDTASLPAPDPQPASPSAGSPPPPPPPTGENSVGMRMVLLEPGSFQFGSPETEAGRYPDEEMTPLRLPYRFAISAHEVTMKQFATFVQATRHVTDAEREGWCYGLDSFEGDRARVEGMSWRNPGFSQEDNHPVVCVSWNDATAFCAWLSKQESRLYRLPTEAEWEYACRGGTRSPYFWGSDLEGAPAFCNGADVAFRKGTKLGTTDIFPGDDGAAFTWPVGSRNSNHAGIFDMHGNVWEWTLDWYSAKYAPETASAPKSSSKSKTLRGGSWLTCPRLCRSAARSRRPPDSRSNCVGFRVVRVEPQ